MSFKNKNTENIISIVETAHSSVRPYLKYSPVLATALVVVGLVGVVSAVTASKHFNDTAVFHNVDTLVAGASTNTARKSVISSKRTEKEQTAKLATCVSNCSNTAMELAEDTVVLTKDNSWTYSVDVVAGSGKIKSLEFSGYNTGILSLEAGSKNVSENTQSINIKLLKKTITSNGSETVTVVARDSSDMATTLTLNVEWKSFEYEVSLGAPVITINSDGSRSVDVPVNIGNVPDGDNPVITYQFTTNLPYEYDTALSGTWSYENPWFGSLYVPVHELVSGKTYSITAHIRVSGLGDYDSTITQTITP